MYKILFFFILLPLHLFAIEVEVYALEAMPYCGTINGEPVGLAVEILNEATKYGAPEFLFNFNIPWARAQEKILNSGDKLIAIIPFSKTEKRIDKYKWIAELFTTQSYLYSFGRDQAIDSIEKAKKTTIGVVRGHAIIHRLMDLGITKLDDGSANAEINAKKLLNRRFDTIADSDLISLYNWKKLDQKIDSLQVGIPIGDITGVYLAGNLNFSEKVSTNIKKALEEMKKNGTLEKICDKWKH